ncbi:unnamed protein product [Periconia digitata]|uniref:Uncharacterized protein n=1 Tax=Periconia digitata TaxID=1303443 RepID=A0A9W4UNG2_9PLEO|nr:unnamed protein product [Periconia digitata]
MLALPSGGLKPILQSDADAPQLGFHGGDIPTVSTTQALAVPRRIKEDCCADAASGDHEVEGVPFLEFDVPGFVEFIVFHVDKLVIKYRSIKRW